MTDANDKQVGWTKAAGRIRLSERRIRALRFIHLTILLTFVTLLSITLSGCTSIKAYEGSTRRPDEVARITQVPPKSVFQVDVDNTVSGVFDSGIKVLPGKHKVTVTAYRLSSYGLRSYKLWSSTLEFDAEAGKTYIVDGRSYGRWQAWILEASTGAIVAGKAPPAHITGDRNNSPPLPFIKRVQVYTDKEGCLNPSGLKSGRLTIDDRSIEIQITFNETEIQWLGPARNVQKEMLLKIPRTNIAKVSVENLSSIVKCLSRDRDAIFIYFVESGVSKFVAINNLPDDTEEESKIYSALLQLMETPP